MIKNSWIGYVGMGLILGFTQTVQAQSMASSLGVVAFPPEDKNAQQISDDESYCYNWAVGNSGIDPLAAANQQAQQQPQQQQGGNQAVKGAAAGAAAGVLIGDTGKSAATGAAIGMVGGGIASRRQSRAQADAQAQVQQQSQSDMNDFNRNFGACLSSRGYTVQ